MGLPVCAVQHRRADDRAESPILEPQRLQAFHTEPVRGRLWIETPCQLACLADGTRRRVHPEHCTSLFQQAHKVPAVAAPGVEDRHVGSDAAPQQLVEQIDVDLTKLLSQGPGPIVFAGVRHDRIRRSLPDELSRRPSKPHTAERQQEVGNDVGGGVHPPGMAEQVQRLVAESRERREAAQQPDDQERALFAGQERPRFQQLLEPPDRDTTGDVDRECAQRIRAGRGALHETHQQKSGHRPGKAAHADKEVLCHLPFPDPCC